MPTLLWSSEGGLQGDPLMLHIYGLAWRPVLEHTLENIIDKETDDGMSVVDDTKYIVADEDTVTKILDFLDSTAVKQRGFFLNRTKTKTTKLSDIANNGGECYGMYIGPLDKKREWLDAKVDSLLTTVKRLAVLRSQDALILLRKCHSIELAHLLRCMDLTGCEDILLRLDEGLRSALDHLRASTTKATEDPAARKITDALFHLPMRHGGVGIISYSLTQKPAREAFLPETATQLKVILNAHENITNNHLSHLDPQAEIPKQRARTELVHGSQLRALIGHLNPYQTSIFGDQQNKLNAAWMHADPTCRRHTLTTKEVSVGLRQRTLQPAQLQPLCAHCGGSNMMRHAESCAGAKNFRTVRHNAVCDWIVDLVTKGLPYRKNVATREDQVVLPATGAHSTDRTDVRIIGPDAPNESANDIDVKIIAITLYRYSKAPAAAREKGSDEVSRHSIKQECKAKKKHYQDDCTTKYPFLPLLITTGGTMDEASEKWLKELQTQTTERQVRVELSALLLKFTTKITSIRN